MCNCNIVMCVNTGKAGSARVAVAVGAVTLTAVEVHKGLWAQRGHAAPAPGGAEGSPRTGHWSWFYFAWMEEHGGSMAV